MSGFGAKAYSKLGLHTDVITAEPHKMVAMLFDGAILSIERAKLHLAANRVTPRCEAITLAIEIVENLRVSIDPSVDPVFAGRLNGLYHFVTMRLLQANVRRDVKALDEAGRILGELRGAWLRIAPAARAADAAAPATPTTMPRAVPATAARALSAYQA